MSERVTWNEKAAAINEFQRQYRRRKGLDRELLEKMDAWYEHVVGGGETSAEHHAILERYCERLREEEQRREAGANRLARALAAHLALGSALPDSAERETALVARIAAAIYAAPRPKGSAAPTIPESVEAAAEIVRIAAKKVEGRSDALGEGGEEATTPRGAAPTTFDEILADPLAREELERAVERWRRRIAALGNSER